MKSGIPKNVPANARNVRSCSVGRAFTKRKPSRISSNTPRFSALRCTGGIFMMNIAKITAMNDTPFTAKHAAAPHNA